MKRTSSASGLLAVAILASASLLHPSGAADSTLNARARRGRHDSAPAPAPQPRRGDGDGTTKASPPAAPAHRRHGLFAPSPTSGADAPPKGGGFARAPEQARAHFGFPLQPAVGLAAPPAGEGYPFIGSNPTVPLPTGMTDTANVLPLPDTGDATATAKVVGRAAFLRLQNSMIAFPIIFSVLFFLLYCEDLLLPW